MKYLRLFFYLTYLVLPSVTTKIFEIFPCTDVDPDNESSGEDNYYLTADMSISCTSDYYYRGVAFACVMIIVYPVGVPLLYFVLLYTNKDEIVNRDNKGWKKTIGDDGAARNSALDETGFHSVASADKLRFASVRDTTLSHIEVSRGASLSIAATESTIAAANMSLISFLWASYEPRYVCSNLCTISSSSFNVFYSCL